MAVWLVQPIWKAIVKIESFAYTFIQIFHI